MPALLQAGQAMNVHLKGLIKQFTATRQTHIELVVSTKKYFLREKSFILAILG
jgi:hypothetical protein